MRNLREYPITEQEVIDFLAQQIELEAVLDELTPKIGGVDRLCAETALAVVKAAAIIVQNDIGSTAADLLGKAFNSQNVAPQLAEVSAD